jgi:hypothetical protein
MMTTLFPLFFWFIAVASAVDVVEHLGEGITINWTTMTLKVSESATGYGTESSKRAVEQMARQKVGPGIMYGAKKIKVSEGVELGSLLKDHKLSDPLASRVARWYVSESHYFASGKVGLVGQLFLRDVMKPIVLDQAVSRPDPVPQPRYTGLVIDARQVTMALAYLPVIRGYKGEVLFESLLWEDVVLERTPVLYVTDPSEPAAKRAGDTPMFIHATGADGSVLELDKTETLRFQTALKRADVLGEGRVVIVVSADD